MNRSSREPLPKLTVPPRFASLAEGREKVRTIRRQDTIALISQSNQEDLGAGGGSSIRFIEKGRHQLVLLPVRRARHIDQVGRIKTLPAYQRPVIRKHQLIPRRLTASVNITVDENITAAGHAAH